MAYYTPEEIKDILRKLSKEPPGEVNYVKFERMGVLVNPDSDEDDEGAKPKVEQDEGLAHVCAECKKKLISAHLLDLHVSETHDSYFDLQKDKKPMVSLCFASLSKFISTTSYSTLVISRNVTRNLPHLKNVKITASGFTNFPTIFATTESQAKRRLQTPIRWTQPKPPRFLLPHHQSRS